MCERGLSEELLDFSTAFPSVRVTGGGASSAIGACPDCGRGAKEPSGVPTALSAGTVTGARRTVVALAITGAGGSARKSIAEAAGVGRASLLLTAVSAANPRTETTLGLTVSAPGGRRAGKYADAPAAGVTLFASFTVASAVFPANTNGSNDRLTPNAWRFFSLLRDIEACGPREGGTPAMRPPSTVLSETSAEAPCARPGPR